eukprot:jgi/Mesvir1/16771/Mv15143-RA.1
MDDSEWYARVYKSRSYKHAMNEEARKRRADANWTAFMMRRAARGYVYKYNLSFNREYMQSFGSLYYRGKQELTEDEKAVVDAYKTEGEPALKGEQLAVWTAPTVPPKGWVSCIVCNGIMPADKVEFTKPMPSRDLYVFYHATCFDSLVGWKAENVHQRIPPAPPVTETVEVHDMVTSHKVDWDLDKPSGGYDS